MAERDMNVLIRPTEKVYIQNSTWLELVGGGGGGGLP